MDILDIRKNRTVYTDYIDISTFVTGISVNLMLNTWLINNKASLNTIGCSDIQLGILISFLCEASFQVTDEYQDRIINIKVI